jgi:hypothetical protein
MDPGSEKAAVLLGFNHIGTSIIKKTILGLVGIALKDFCEVKDLKLTFDNSSLSRSFSIRNSLASALH